MNTVKKTCISSYDVLNQDGDLVGSFNFSRYRAAGGKVLTRCLVKPADGESYETSHCYFSDVKRDAANGSLFNNQ